MPKVSDKVFAWAQDCFESAVEELLDDPANLLHPWRDCEPPEEIAGWRERAKDLGMDFDALVEQHGSDYEKQRLRDIETGVIPPLPADPVERDRLNAAVDAEVVRRMPASAACDDRRSASPAPSEEAASDTLGSELTNWMPPANVA